MSIDGDCAAPDLAEFDRLAREAYDELPRPFRKLCGNIVIHVAEVAESEILHDLGIDDPLDLSGLFEGVALTEQSIDDIALTPNHVHLYRQAILAEWRARGGISLGALIRHVLVHEIGHHFGLSDEEMLRIEGAEQ
ncbi:MAG: metallopeptidase family protein [Parvularculaceae bacterium]